eukprot:TRINITY_DN559_c1_g1_i1.p1 TRINITY_DN559_c1_g1~~TRINITY_DN559_c1_g1_i1.p1  ORF type:complete len:224 (+),score=56.81 TRINITY_DN559_c1_g1_i1:110-781(+)
MESIDDKFVRACMHGDAASVEFLLRSGASVDCELSTWNYDTPLVLAAQAGHVAVCASLLAAKADPNIRTQTSDTTALVEAVRFSHADVVDVLLSNGANPSVLDSNGNQLERLAQDDVIVEKLKQASPKSHASSDWFIKMDALGTLVSCNVPKEVIRHLTLTRRTSLYPVYRYLSEGNGEMSVEVRKEVLQMLEERAPKIKSIYESDKSRAAEIRSSHISRVVC